jgi:hypothetical protein
VLCCAEKLLPVRYGGAFISTDLGSSSNYLSKNLKDWVCGGGFHVWTVFDHGLAGPKVVFE